ncbi:hypothetical protein chiPu_0021560, partial [Chiloscyllium punctatum]|nr:hypothetical protein [Chiloscyllium punctatum]
KYLMDPSKGDQLLLTPSSNCKGEDNNHGHTYDRYRFA